jgi:hypothetical protein
VSRKVSRNPKARLLHSGFWLFLLLAAVYLLSYSGSFHAIDEVSVAAMTESLVKHGRVTTDQIQWSQNWTPSQGRVGPDGHLYSKKGVGSALLGAPFYWLSLRLPEVGAVRALMLANALVTALTGWLVYACVWRLDYRPAVAALTGLGYGLGTMAWPYAKYFFSEPLIALGLMLALWGLLVYRQNLQVRYAFLGGLGMGVALLAKVANVVTWPLFLAYGGWVAVHPQQERAAREKERLITAALAFLLPMVIAGLVLAGYNAARTGHLLDLGYAADETFSTALWYGLAGQLLSPGKSLFLFSPILLAALFGIPALLRRDMPTALLSLGVIAVYPLLYGRWYMWWGGWSWGPRFLVPVLPFLSLFLAPVVDWVLRPSRWWAQALLAVLALLSLLVQVLGVTVDFNDYLLLLYERGIDSGEAIFRVELSPHLGHWTLLRAGVWDLAWVRDLATGVGWSRLLWPLALLAVILAGWHLASGLGRLGRWLFAAAAMVMLAISMMMVARLPTRANDWQAGCQELSTALQQAAQPDDAMIVDFLAYSSHWDLATALLDRYKAGPAYLGWARQEPVSVERQALLAGIARKRGRLWLALDTTPEADPASTTERWLDENAFRVGDRWLSPSMRLVWYQVAGGTLAEGREERLDLRLGDRLWLEGYSPAGPLHSRAGDVLSFSLYWQAEEMVGDDYMVFIQLLDREGRLRAQLDRQPVGGFRPTSTWQPGETVRDNYGLELPADLPPGDYQLIAGLYLPASMERLTITSADGVPLGDFATLDMITVEPLSGSTMVTGDRQ